MEVRQHAHSIHLPLSYDVTNNTGHTSRPTDFCWAPGSGENWTACSTAEDNIIQVWQPTMRVWAGDEVKIDESELEGGAGRQSSAGGAGTGGMEGIEESKPQDGGDGMAED